MLNRQKHQLIMGQILKDIYDDTSISSLLGFKGGTCSYFFYKLPRFSVDLNFDLLMVTEENKKIVFEKVATILKKYGDIKDSYIKRFTVFALLSYGPTDHNIKIEVSTRELVPDLKKLYAMKEYLGISMLVAKKDYLFAGKLLALTLRGEVAMRDIFDIHYYAKNNWSINPEVIKARTNQTTKEYLATCLAFVEKIKESQMLHELGEVIESEKEKVWIKNHLKNDTIFLLKNYMSALSVKDALC